MYVATTQPFTTTTDKNLKGNLQFVILTNQGHPTRYELVDPKQGYYYVKFERPHLNSVCEKANINIFVKSGNMSIIILVYMWKSNLVVYLWSTWCT